MLWCLKAACTSSHVRIKQMMQRCPETPFIALIPDLQAWKPCMTAHCRRSMLSTLTLDLMCHTLKPYKEDPPPMLYDHHVPFSHPVAMQKGPHLRCPADGDGAARCSQPPVPPHWLHPQI